MNNPPASSNPLSASPPPRPAPLASPGVPAYYGGAPAMPYYGESPSAANPLRPMDPLRLLAIARKKWLTILLAVLFAWGAALFYLSKTPRIYQSRSTIELSVRRPRILNKQEAMIEDPAAMMQIEDTLNTQIEKFKSKTMLPHVVASYRSLYPDDPISDDVLAARLAGRVSFSLVRHTRLVRVSCLSSIPEFAVKACNAYAAGAEASARAENKAVSDAAVAWLEAQATGQKNKLEASDNALLDARQKYQMDVMAGQRKTVESALLAFNDSLVQIESKASLERKLLEAFEAAELNPEGAGKLPADIPRAADVGVSLERWRAAVTERDALLSRYTPEHPAVVAQDQAVALYRDQAMAALKRAKTTAAANLALYEEQTKGLRAKKEEQLKLASDLDRDILTGGMNIAALERERSAADSSYLGVLFRIQEARLSADENTATVKLVESASVPIQVQPRPARILFLALLIGLGIGFGLAFLSYLLEDRVMGAGDVETGAGIKILAVIPHVRTRNRKEIATASL
ncbi:MAG: GumC family protein, partial [Kiritimatiellia bacterium]